MGDFIWIVIALPLVGAIASLAFGKRLGEPTAGYLGATTVALAFGYALIASLKFVAGHAEPDTVHLFDWIPSLGLGADFLWDPLSATMTLIITGVGTLIHLYSIGYMHGDERFARFFTYLNFFVASMLILVLGENFGIMFVGWELVGLSSYLLISFWFTKPTAAAAGKKAFIVNRIGDFGFLIGLMIIFASFGTLSYSHVFEDASQVLNTGTATAITLLLLVGAAGKSAQIPLYVWLPDAMEGPTPVSALIHAATMVTAGVYMVARAAPLYELAPVSGGVVATIGALTALLAATIAIAQKDIKRVLAYSTISQLGYMFMAVGAAAYVAGVFHLLTHAFFKALLFLGAGSVIHGMSGEQDMNKMGGLRKAMPVTFMTMAVAWLAISGIFPLSGFWSKDEILASVFDHGGPWLVLWGIGIVTAGLTAFYMTRMMVLTFWGESRWEDGVHPHESPSSMTLPLVVLAGLSAFAGFINTPFLPSFEHFLDPVFERFEVELAHLPSGITPWILALISLAAGGAGILYGIRRYSKAVPAESDGIWATVREGYRVDDLYGNLLVLPGKELSEVAAFTVDAKGVDGIVNGVGGLVQRVGQLLKPLQSGFVRSYGIGVLVGTVGLLAWFMTRVL